MLSPVSVLIPVKNEAHQIGSCLNCLSWAAERVVVDSNSTDGTGELARALGARVVQFEYRPGGLKKKNWALRHVDFLNEWILIVDADERVTAPLAREIDTVVRDRTKQYVGYYINRRFYFLGRWVRHAGYFPSWNLRLLRRGYGEYEFVPDYTGETGDNEVHEHIVLRGPAGKLKGTMDHYAYPTIQTFIEKHNRYSTWEAIASRNSGWVGEAGKIPPQVVAKRLLKTLARRAPCPEVWRFFYHYFLRLGFLDGVQGYILCRLLAEYEFLIWAKSWEAQRSPTICQSEKHGRGSSMG